MHLSLASAALRLGIPEGMLRQWVWDDARRTALGLASDGPPYVGSWASPEFQRDALDAWLLANVHMVGALN